APASVEDPYAIQVSSTTDARLITGGFEKRFGTTVFLLKAGHVSSDRKTCSMWSEVCAQGHFVRTGQYAEGDPSALEFPHSDWFIKQNGLFWGGDQFTSTSVRADAISQMTDHHRIQVGAGLSTYDLTFDESRAIEGGSRQVFL